MTRLLRLKIFKRDGGVCQICFKEVIEPKGSDAFEFSVTGSAGRARAWFDIDHIIPMSGGGQDVPSNLRLAHPGCNRGRSKRSYEEAFDKYYESYFGVPHK